MARLQSCYGYLGHRTGHQVRSPIRTKLATAFALVPGPTNRTPSLSPLALQLRQLDRISLSGGRMRNSSDNRPAAPKPIPGVAARRTTDRELTGVGRSNQPSIAARAKDDVGHGPMTWAVCSHRAEFANQRNPSLAGLLGGTPRARSFREETLMVVGMKFPPCAFSVPRGTYQHLARVSARVK
jgi:hypothetical protein